MNVSTLVFFAWVLSLICTENGGNVSVAVAKTRIHIPDELDDVVDDEEDEKWEEWGKKSNPVSPEFDPPPDMTGMEQSQIQSEMLKRHFGPSIGFVKLQLGVPRSREDVPEIAMRWTKVLRTGSIDAKFMAVDTNTLMFTMGKGQDTEELKDFVLSQPEAYEFKMGDLVYRRPGDRPLEEVIEMLRRKKSKTDSLESIEEMDDKKDEF